MTFTAPTPAQPPARQQRHFTHTEWALPATGNTAPLQAALDAAHSDTERGDHPVWYRLDHTPAGPTIVVGYTTETTA